MLKYLETEVVFREVPDEVSLAINISNCQNHCIGCHSPYLREDIGEELTNEVLDKLIKENDGISCVCFMGEGNDSTMLRCLARHIKTNYPNLKSALYSGRNIEDIKELMPLSVFFDYIKTGEYNAEYGPLNNPNTNQRMWKWDGTELVDITYKFW